MARSADGYCAGAQNPDPRIKLEQRVRHTLTGQSVNCRWRRCRPNLPTRRLSHVRVTGYDVSRHSCGHIGMTGNGSRLAGKASGGLEVFLICPHNRFLR